MKRNIKRARFWIGNPHLYQEPTVNDYFILEDELTRGIAIYQRQYPGDLAPYVGEFETAVFDHCTYYRLAKSTDFREELEGEWAELQYKVEWCHPYRALFSNDIGTFVKGPNSWFLTDDFTILTRDPNNTNQDENDIVYDIPDLPYPKKDPDGLADITPTHILTDQAFEQYESKYCGDYDDQELSQSELETLREEWETVLEENGGNEVKVILSLGNAAQILSEKKYFKTDDLLNELLPHIGDLIQVGQVVGAQVGESVINGEDGFQVSNANPHSVNYAFLLLVAGIGDGDTLSDESILLYKYARFFNTLKKSKKACVSRSNQTMYIKAIPIQTVELLSYGDELQLAVTYLTNPNVQTMLYCNPVYNDKQYGLYVTNYSFSSELPVSTVASYDPSQLSLDAQSSTGTYIYDITGLFQTITLENKQSFESLISSSGNEGYWDDSGDGGGIKKGGDTTKGGVTKEDNNKKSGNTIYLSVISTVVNVRLRLTKEYSVSKAFDAVFYVLFDNCNLGIPAYNRKQAVSYNTPDIFRSLYNSCDGLTQNAYANYVTSWQELAVYGQDFIFKEPEDDQIISPIFILNAVFDPSVQDMIIEWWNSMWPNEQMPDISAEYHQGKQFGFQKIAAASWINHIEINFMGMDFTNIPFVVGDFKAPKSTLDTARTFRLMWKGIDYQNSDNTPSIYPGNIDLTNMDDLTQTKAYFKDKPNTVIDISQLNNVIVLANGNNESENNPQWLSSKFKFPKYINLLYLNDFSMHNLDLKKLTMPAENNRTKTFALVMNSIFTDNIILPEGDYNFRLNGCITQVLDMSNVQAYQYYKDRNFNNEDIIDFVAGDISVYSQKEGTFGILWYIDNLRNNVVKDAVYLPQKDNTLVTEANDPAINEFYVIQGGLGSIRTLQNGFEELDYSGLMKGGPAIYNFIPPSNYPSLHTINFGDNPKYIRFLGQEEIISNIENIVGEFTVLPNNDTINLVNMPYLSSTAIDKIIDNIDLESQPSSIIFNEALEGSLTQEQTSKLTAGGLTITYSSVD